MFFLESSISSFLYLFKTRPFHQSNSPTKTHLWSQGLNLCGTPGGDFRPSAAAGNKHYFNPWLTGEWWISTLNFADIYLNKCHGTKKSRIFIRCGLRPAANAQRATLRSQRRPATQGTKVSFIKCWWCRCFSPGRKKHPKEPYVLKGHVTFKSWTLLINWLAWVGCKSVRVTVRNSAPAMCNSEFGCCYSNCTCTNDLLHFCPTRVRCLLQGFKKANNHTVQVWQPYKLYRTNKLNQMLFLPGRGKKLGRIRITQMLFFWGEKKASKEKSPRYILADTKTTRKHHPNAFFWWWKKHLGKIAQMHFLAVKKKHLGNITQTHFLERKGKIAQMPGEKNPQGMNFFKCWWCRCFYSKDEKSTQKNHTC